MCGIVGYIGQKNALPILIEGLRRLEYRGYDSAGVALWGKDSIWSVKTSGKIKNLEDYIKSKEEFVSSLGISHTRWATHGAPTKANAHPHHDCSKNIFLVHNGIIENHQVLKDELLGEGHCFSSQTDTEVIAHLIEKYYRNNNSFFDAFLKAINRLEGSFALALICHSVPDRLFFARRGSPLIVGVGNGENFVASDVPAILAHTNKVIYLKDNQAGELSKEEVKIFDLELKPQKVKIEKVLWDFKSAQKSGYRHFMLKEIFEQPEISRRLASISLKFDKNICRLLRGVKNIIIVACGTAYHAGLVGKYAIEEIAGVPVTVDLSSEFRYRFPLIPDKSVLVAISQSGETADTLAAVREAKRRGIKVLAICNVVGSSLVRESDCVLYTYAGPEISVASSKAYTAQLMILYLVGLYLAKVNNFLSQSKIESYRKILLNISRQQKDILKKSLKKISAIAQRHHHFGSFLFLGRNIHFPCALEGALKLKEISYIPAEGYAAGEMKHGPIALIDEYRAVVCIAVDSVVYEKMISNIQEIKARKGKIVIIATEGNEEVKNLSADVIYIPKIKSLFSPLLIAIPLQLFAYHVADKMGCPIDQPRNLAKSVTVE